MNVIANHVTTMATASTMLMDSFVTVQVTWALSARLVSLDLYHSPKFQTDALYHSNSHTHTFMHIDMDIYALYESISSNVCKFGYKGNVDMHVPLNQYAYMYISFHMYIHTHVCVKT